MSRYTGPVCRLCRREGEKLYLKGARCYSPKCPVDRRPYPPGQHGQMQSRRKIQDYGLQLREKQKARRIYGVMETQFRHYFAEADRSKGVTGEELLRLLERRLDNVVYRLGLAASRKEARQLVTHRHFAVNGRTVNVPSYLIRAGDTISVRDGHRDEPPIVAAVQQSRGRRTPQWLEFDHDQLRGKVQWLPNRDEIDTDIREQLIVEFYSR
ncbi:MAG TPA: 30S ribosomal protein S4 [Armatimonadetes bacterium]|jgi:small subunit ribosomal protein S4|nr:30S ribosomal protein S4 [Armatimonadota bacterium]